MTHKLDECLTIPRRYPLSVRQCDEAIEEYAREARGLIETAKSIGRNFTKTEDERFQFITQTAVPAWQQERGHAEKFARHVLSQSKYATGTTRPVKS